MIRKKPRPISARRGFSVLELMITILILALLIALVAAIGPSIYYQQRIASTRSTMSSVVLAIEQFSTENPLGAYYNRRDRETFGTLPPYQLAGSNSDNNIRQRYFEPQSEQPKVTGSVNPPTPAQYTLENRVERDIRSGDSATPANRYVRTASASGLTGAADYVNTDDIASLYAYLKIYSPTGLSKVSDRSFQPVIRIPSGPITSKSRLEYVNPSGATSNDAPQTPDSKWEQVLGIVDAWGVPLDYVIYAKLEFGVSRDGKPTYRIVDRRPVLRSLGVDRERYEAAVQLMASGATASVQQGLQMLNSPQAWLWSEDLPRPWFGGQGSGNPGAGAITSNDPTSNNFGTDNVQMTSQFGAADGWIRMVGQGENYKFRPDQD